MLEVGVSKTGADGIEYCDLPPCEESSGDLKTRMAGQMGVALSDCLAG